MKTIDEILDEWYPTIPDEEHNGLYARDKVKLIAQEFADQFRQPDVIKSLPSVTILAEKFAESKREHVVKCRIEKGSIANLGLYLGFIEGYNYVIEELKRGNVLK